MKHIMLDLETMGNGSRAAIIQIGAVEFSTTSLGREFKVNVDLTSSLRAGLEVDGSTIYWWMQQSEAARASVYAPGMSLKDALVRFAEFVRNEVKAEFVWGNGATFDNVILRNAYRAIDEPCPWHFRGDRDMRTLISIAKSKGITGPTVDKGTEHDALDDARRQAQIVQYIVERLFR